MLATPNVENWYMGWDLAGGDPLKIVSDSDKHEFLRRRVDYLLVGSRNEALEKIKEGFSLHLVSKNYLMRNNRRILLVCWSVGH